MNDVRTIIERLRNVFVLFIVKLALASFLVGADVALEKLAKITLEHESFPLQVVELVLDVAFVGTAVIIAVAGVIIAAEVIRSTYEYLKR